MGERSMVVVGVDGSPESHVAVRFALEDAARRGVGVRVVSVYVPPEFWAAAYGLSAMPEIESVAAQHEAVAREAVDAVVANEVALADVPVEVLALPGPPAKALIEQAQGAALLVLGHRGRGGFASAVLGSVGLHCVLHAACPVTIVRPEREQAEAPRVDEAGPAFAPMY